MNIKTLTASAALALAAGPLFAGAHMSAETVTCTDYMAMSEEDQAAVRASAQAMQTEGEDALETTAEDDAMMASSLMTACEADGAMMVGDAAFNMGAEGQDGDTPESERGDDEDAEGVGDDSMDADDSESDGAASN